MFAQRLSELAQRLSERSPTPRATLSHVLMREALVALFYCCCPSRIPWHWHELEHAGELGWLGFPAESPVLVDSTHLCLRLPSTSKSSYLLGLPVEDMKGASFFCFGFTWIILALPVLSEDI